MRGGKCVRLLQGDYKRETVYSDFPFEMAKSFENEGARWIHMVDLDGAKDGKRVNDAVVIKTAKELKINVQIGGGIRTEEDIAHYLENDISRVIIGSIAVINPDFTIKMIRKYGSKIAIGLDAKNGYVATHGWRNTSKVKATELGKRYADAGAENFVFTDIATDGMLSGPNVKAMRLLANEAGKNVIASGGVSKLTDLTSLRNFYEEGIVGAIVGRAIYEKRFTVREALEGVKE